MFLRSLVISTVLGMLCGAPLLAAQKASEATDKLSTDQDKTSYALGTTIGRQIAGMLRSNETNVVAKYLVIGIQDVLENNKFALSNEEIQEVMKTLTAAAEEKRKKMQVEQEKRKKELAAQGEKNAVTGTAYLEANAKKEGVKTTATGLQYRVLKEGTGEQPKATDKVKVHYRGTLTDGTEFDSSYKRGQPVQFGLSNVIGGWTEGVQLMKIGAKYEFAIHWDLAYKDAGRPPTIPPKSVLIFEVELLEIVKE